jgi:hypothetical protein
MAPHLHAQSNGGNPDAAHREAMAEAIVAREEAASGRDFDRTFRLGALKSLAAGSLEDLQASLGQTGGLGVNLMGDSQADLVFTPVTPCRIIDTRLAGGPISAGATRDFLVTGDTTSQGGANCGIPNGPATAAVINFVAVSPSGSGNLRGWPYGGSLPNASIINYAAVAGLNIANGVVLTLCNPAATTCAKDLSLYAGVKATHVVADVLGYFRKVRKEQITPSVQTALIDSADVICQGGGCCTHQTGASFAVSAPVAGTIVARAVARIRFDHLNPFSDFVNVYIGSSEADCSGPASYYLVPGAWATSGSAPVATLPVSRSFSVGPGNYSVWVNANAGSASAHAVKFEQTHLEVEFIPN